MATNNREEHGSQPTAADAIDASLIVATCQGDCQKLKDLIIQKDATTMVVVMASRNQASEEKSSPATMHPLLAEAACNGSLVELKFLLNRAPVHCQECQDHLEACYPGYSSNRSLATQLTATNIEGGMNASSILEGVTVEGDTAFHLLAANGHGDNLMDCANLIYEEDKSFLYKENYNGDTPLHCATRMGNSQMVSCLISLARGENRVTYLLRKENNSKETALHEAVRIGDNHIVKELMRADPELTRFPEEGPSALYLAILLEKGDVAQTLYDESKDNVLSYTGPDGQNALHAAVMRRTEMVRMLLIWNKGLTSGMDCNGSTPLHFLSSRLKAIRIGHSFLRFRTSPWPIGMLVEANPAALYQPDHSGMFPIHVAASAGAGKTIAGFIRYRPSSAGLRDSRGRTFLHIAAEKSEWRIVALACGIPSLAWILNMQDVDGNTALHVVVKAGCLRSFRSLLGNPQVHLNLANKKGETPFDISRFNTPPGIYYSQSSQAIIDRVLEVCCARHGSCRWDHFTEARKKQVARDSQSKEAEKLKDSTQNLCIGSVLIATVTFGATFALPGGYRADDHTNGGTPTLAGSYTFDAFMIETYLKWAYLIRPLCSRVGLTVSLNAIAVMICAEILVHYWPILVIFGWPAIAGGH